jgi:hypothetical protein
LVSDAPPSSPGSPRAKIGGRDDLTHTLTESAQEDFRSPGFDIVQRSCGNTSRVDALGKRPDVATALLVTPKTATRALVGRQLSLKRKARFQAALWHSQVQNADWHRECGGGSLAAIAFAQAALSRSSPECDRDP